MSSTRTLAKRLGARKRLAAAVVAGSMATLALGGTAVADLLNADGDGNVLNTIKDTSKTPGASGSAVFYLTNPNNNPTGDRTGCNAGGGSSAVTVTVRSSNSAVVAGSNAADPTLLGTVVLTDCDAANAQSLAYTVKSAATPGHTAQITGTASGGKPDSQYAYTNGSNTFTVTVAAPPDSTPPVITPDVQGTLGDNGWYTSDVDVSFDVSDAESAITSKSAGCDGGTVDTDTTGTTFTCTATSGGGTDTESVTVKRDATQPVIVRDDSADDCSLPGDAGWCRGTQTAGFSASDATSGLVDGDGNALASPHAFTQESAENGDAVSIASGTITDAAGNEADSIDAGPFTIDSVAPEVACGSEPSFLLNQSPADVTASVTDGGSGPASSPVSSAADTSSVGSKSVTVNGGDVAGNEESASCAYSVGYQFVGFSRPVDNHGAWNSAKAGQAIPIKWRLLDANNQPVTNLSGVTPTVASQTCSLGATLDAVEEYAAGSSGLQNLGDGYYQFNWKSPTSYASSCKMLKLDLGEADPRTALFKFMK